MSTQSTFTLERPAPYFDWLDHIQRSIAPDPRKFFHPDHDEEYGVLVPVRFGDIHPGANHYSLSSFGTLNNSYSVTPHFDFYTFIYSIDQSLCPIQLPSYLNSKKRTGIIRRMPFVNTSLTWALSTLSASTCRTAPTILT